MRSSHILLPQTLETFFFSFFFSILFQKLADRDQRKRQVAEKKEEMQGLELLETVRSRNIKFKGKGIS